jgi:hypothetical protein
MDDRPALVFLHSAAANRDLALQCIAYAVLAGTCLQAGRWVAGRLRPADTQMQFPLVGFDVAKMRIVLLGLIASMGMGVLLYGPAVFFSGYNIESTASTATLGTALIYLSIEWLGLAMAYGVFASRATSRRLGWGAVGLAVVVLLFMGIVRGKRLEVISAFLPLGLLLFANHRLFRTARARLTLVAIAAVMVSSMASIRFGEVPTPASLAFNFVSEGVYAGHSLPGILERLNTGQIDYEYGARLLAGVFAFVPRFVWPDKDEFLYAGNEALEGVAPLGATNLLAEVVLQGGATAVIIWFTALGFLFGRLHSSLREFDSGSRSHRLHAGIIGYLVVIASFIPHFRDGLIPAVKIALQSTVFFFFVAGLRLVPELGWRIIIVRREPPRPINALQLPGLDQSVR